MNNEFQKHKKKDAVKWIVTFVAILMLGTMVAAIITQGFTNGNPYGWFDKECVHEYADGVCKNCGEKEPTETPTDETDINASPLQMEVVSENGVFLSVGEAVAAAETNTVSKTITATIKPSDSKNKAVDWSIAWNDSTITENIAEYLVVAPTSDGSLTANVTCLLPFGTKVAVVTVTTREGGFSAFCYISYVGEPSTITVNSGKVGNCNMGGSASYSVNLSNVFDSVGSEFYEDISITNISFTGTCSTAVKWVTIAGRNQGTITYTGINNDVSVNSLKYEGTTNLTEKFVISVSGNSLSISAPSLAGVYSVYNQGSPQESYNDSFYGNWNCYADITVACGSVSSTFRVNFIVGVEGVSLTPTALVF